MTCPACSVVLVTATNAAYIRNGSNPWPDINAQVKETLRGPGFFDMPFIFDGQFDDGEVYDLSHAMLLGAQINRP